MLYNYVRVSHNDEGQDLKFKSGLVLMLTNMYYISHLKPLMIMVLYFYTLVIVSYSMSVQCATYLKRKIHYTTTFSCRITVCYENSLKKTLKNVISLVIGLNYTLLLIFVVFVIAMLQLRVFDLSIWAKLMLFAEMIMSDVQRICDEIPTKLSIMYL